jgi:Mg2+ and Co2+ transporter CorA
VELPTTREEIEKHPENAWLYGAKATRDDLLSEPTPEEIPESRPKTPKSPATVEVSLSLQTGKGSGTARAVPPGFKPNEPGSSQGFDILGANGAFSESESEDDTSFADEERVSISDQAQTSCKVSIIDYGERCVTRTFYSVAELSEFLETDEKDDEKPTTARWIHVEGIDLPIIRLLALRYSLHPLSIEDLTTFPPVIKIDTFSNVLFLNCVLATLDDHRFGSGWFEKEGPRAPVEMHRFHRLRMMQSNAESYGNFVPRLDTKEPDHLLSEEPALGGFPLMYSMRGGKSSWFIEDDPRDKMRWCNVAVEPVAIFLHRSSTLISIFSNEADEVIAPIVQRLQMPDTLLRRSMDPSFLMEGLLDGIVDRIVQVVEEYSDEVEKMERKVFGNPRQIHTKQLHLVLLELHALRRVIGPLDAVVEQLRQTVPKDLGDKKTKGDDEHEGIRSVSKLTIFYLGDVADHLRFATEELAALEVRIDDLSNLITNWVNHAQNSSMRLLAFVSLIFLPLTFIAGIYGVFPRCRVAGLSNLLSSRSSSGMNFKKGMVELDWEYGYYFFYVICFVSVVLIVFVFQWLEKHYADWSER